MTNSINQLRIYTQARVLEDRVYEVVKALPDDQAYPIGNDLRRASAAVSHFISEAHRRYSYTLKLQSLVASQASAEGMKGLLDGMKTTKEVRELHEGYDEVVRQSAGLIKYLRSRRAKRLAEIA